MNIALTLIGALVALFLCLAGGYTLLYFAANRIKNDGVEDAIDEMADLPDVSTADKVAARRCIERAVEADAETTLYDWSAPFVVAIACIGLSKTATHLPRWARKWDNNISINGDGLAVLRDGEWLSLRDGIEALPGERVVTYDDPDFTGPLYFKVLGLKVKPRSWLARWGWAGLRNRASQMSVDLGVDVAARPVLLSGDLEIHSSKEGHFLLRDGDTYHYKIVSKVRLLGVQCALIRSVGYKLEVTKMRGDDALGRVAAVAIGCSYKRWKGA
ncbi:hypothetical protein FVQ98_14480 [Ottowia sp. GY511]|uniref:Uncharacterized protein n=1 Tax=Ottowia flava TaxID=2675430 RepID=A0ABW4KNK2_9BURK|nr:hypothetical protein [Ottowia sp. GY511]TXK26361.1 hypothetical protein FVQ98_14480 [Ottowia sp. GY511]